MWNRYALKVVKYTCPPILVAAIIFYLCCLITSDDIPDHAFWEHTDKVVHFLMYFGLSLVASIGYVHGEKGHIIILKLILFAFILPMLYGGLIEILQHYFIEGRSGDWFDFMADCLGSLAALPLALYYRSYIFKRQLV